jgi:hypothetical protein
MAKMKPFDPALYRNRPKTPAIHIAEQSEEPVVLVPRKGPSPETLRELARYAEAGRIGDFPDDDAPSRE